MIGNQILPPTLNIYLETVGIYFRELLSGNQLELCVLIKQLLFEGNEEIV